MAASRSAVFSREWANSIFFVVGVVLFAGLVLGGICRSCVLKSALPAVSYDYGTQYRDYAESPSSRHLGALRRAAAVDFDNIQAQMNLLIAARRLRDPESAILALRGLARLTPGDFHVHHELAVTCLEVGNPADALMHIEVAILAAPREADLYCVRGASLLALGKQPEAAAAYRMALRINPQQPTARRVLENQLKGVEPVRSSEFSQ